MSDLSPVCDALMESLRVRGPEGVLDALEERFRGERKYHELFEVLKMKSRRALGLAMTATEPLEQLDESIRGALEDRLLEACREVGTLLMESGKLREGWIYLRPVGDRRLAEKYLRAADEEGNVDELVELAVAEGIAPAFGYSLILKHFGTCNSITAFETQIRHLPKVDQQECAALAIAHLHGELLRNVQDDIARRTETRVTGSRLLELIADRDWLFGEMSYHVDTTHLASVVRFARMVEDRPSLELALDLTEYGCRLHERFQYQGDEPFGELHPASRRFFRALLGIEVDEAVRYFGDKAEATDVYYQGTAPLETYIDLLQRVGRFDQAIAVLIAKLPPGSRTQGIAPTLFELCRKAGSFRPMLELCREKGDVLGFATALLQEQAS